MIVETSKMSTKEKIYQLIDQLDDEKQLQILEELEQILKPELDPVLKAKLSRRVDRSEEDIKAGRVHTIDEARKIMNQRLGL